MGNTASSSLNESQQVSPSIANAAQQPPAECPMHRQGGNEASTSTAKSSRSSSAVQDILNPLNNIPALPQGPLSASQKRALSLDRTYSSIPRSSDSSGAVTADAAPAACPVAHDNLKGKSKATDQDASSNHWVYPSPQQFYNALMRKGKETPEESVDSMVEIHNFLNEKAWDEIRRWEDRRSPNERIELARFEGRPHQLSPKARYHLFLGRLFPATHNSTPPFDRHDWHVRRADDGTMQRYVIDYYSCPDDENGMPVFSLDVRPAVDSAGAVYERMTEWARVKREAWTAGASQAQSQAS